MSGPAPVDTSSAIRELGRRRWRVAATLTVAMVALYFGFISLIAFNRALLARKLTDGLSLGILLGALVIVVSWLLTWVYVRWANTHYDTALERINRDAGPR